MTAFSRSKAAERLGDMARLLAEARRAATPVIEAERWSALLASLHDELGALEADDIPACRAELVDLLDEAAALRDRLLRERAQLSDRLDLGGRHRRAGAAYRRAAGDRRPT